jgi:hypothetical protein
MGEHSATEGRDWKTKAAAALSWVSKHRRKIYAALAVGLPLASRWVPDFPSATVLDVLRAFLGV